MTRYLSVKEVATILGISNKTVYKLIYKGKIPGHFMLDSMHFFDEEELRIGLKALATVPKKTASKIHQTRDRHGLMK
ncbi:MAG: DNA-binding protein [Ignavibacteriae bacterium]|nr:MAG: DNA-binding protein [Ignavibacteriota bacterium]